jgi:serine/threonine protein kinase/Tfp pilus assembly protein PilF
MSELRDSTPLPPLPGPPPEEGSDYPSGVPPQVEGYEILEPQGEGGMGTVWRAVQLSTRREVALKLMTKQAFASENARARFQREVELSARLEHPNIARLYDSGLHHGMYYYAMELIDGAPIDEYVRQQRPTPRRVLDLMQTVCEAVHHAHHHGVIHRDLKPSNILVTVDGQPHLLDFGLAKPILEKEADVTLSTVGVVLGTPAYMSPEQALGRKTDWRTDIFSLGVICYELLAGRRPFEGNTASEVLGAIIHKEPLSIDLLCPEVPTDFRRVVDKCLRKEPELRYQHVDDLLVDLKFLQRALESRESVAGKREKSVATVPFINLSDDPADDHFCVGITEDITTDLSKIRGLRVASCSLARSHQARGFDVRGVGRELGVDSVLQGSVRRAGKRLRITAQLISVTDGFHLWAEKFDREIEDIFAVQDEIAVAIAQALQLRLTGIAGDPVQKRGTKNPEAYEEFIKGRFHYWYRNTAADVEAAERHFRRALSLDPSYSHAWIGLADVYNMLWIRGSPDRPKLFEQAKNALHRAEEIDPAMSYGYYTRAWYHAAAGDVMLAEKILREGLDANPEDPVLHCVLGMFQLSRGEVEASERSLVAALKWDPLFHYARVYLAILEAWYQRNVQKALVHLDEVLACAPDFCHALRVKAKCCVQQGDFEGTLRLLDKAKEIDRPWAYQLTMEAIALACLNRPREAFARMEEAVKENPEPTWGTSDQAQALNGTIAFCVLHELDAAFEWLEKTARVFANSYNPRLFEILDNNPALEPLRDDPRFQRLKQEYVARRDKTTSAK